MNVRKIATSVLFTSCLTALAGCLEIETTTTVHPDGSIRRAIRTSGDSSDVFNDKGIFSVDPAWTTVNRKTDSTWESVSTRDFANVQDFQTALDHGGDRALRVHASLGKHFAWFTTTFEYRETIECYNQFHAVPLSKYLTAEEQELLIHHEVGNAPFETGGDSIRFEQLSARTEEWDRRNKFEVYHARFREGAESPQLLAALTPAMVESLYVATKAPMNAGNLDTLPTIYAAVLRVPGVQQVFRTRRTAFEEFAQALTSQQEMLTSGYKRAAIVMPGLLTGTNARSIEGNRVVWEDFLGAAYIADYTMWARSRVINWWAVILTGGVVLVLAALPLVAMIRGRRRERAAV